MKLPGWENSNRLQFSIDKSDVIEDINLLPFIFRLGTDSGNNLIDTTFIFDFLTVGGSSFGSRKKVAFSQLIGGEEVQLFAELDFWDSVLKKAIFWIKPIELSYKHINVFYFYYDSSKLPNENYISDAGQSAMRLMMPLSSQGTYDKTQVFPFSLVKIANLYKIWYLGKDATVSQTRRILYCESTDLVNFSNYRVAISLTHTFDTGTHGKGTVLFISGIYKMWFCGNTNATSTVGYKIGYCTSSDGLNWGSFTQCTGLNISGVTDATQEDCSVIYDGTKYKIWFKTSIAGHGIYKIYYAESVNGIAWTNVTKVLEASMLTFTDVASVFFCNTFYKNNKYVMWFTLSDTGNSGMFVCDSLDGISFSNFSSFLDTGVEGEYDLDGYQGLALLDDSDKYIFIYGAPKNSNYNYNLLIADSTNYYRPLTPSQYVWEDLFTSVNHFNPNYGFKNSVSMTNSSVTISETVSSTKSAIGAYALNFNSSTSFANLGGSYRNTLPNFSQCIINARLISGNSIIYKGTYSYMSYFLYYQQQAPVFRSNYNDNFDGVDDSLPDTYLWQITTGNSRIYNNSLKYSSGLTEEITSNFYIGSNFDISFSFTIDDCSLTSSWSFGVKLVSEPHLTLDYVVRIYKNPSNSICYIECTRMNKNTYTVYGTTTYTTYAEDIYSGSFRIYKLTNDLKVTCTINNDFSYSFNPLFNTLTEDAIYRVLFFKKDTIVRDTTKFYITDFTTLTNNTFINLRNSDKNNSLALDYRCGDITYSHAPITYALNTDWEVYSFGLSNNNYLNVFLGDMSNGFVYSDNVDVLKASSKSTILGGETNSMLGAYSEIFFTKNFFSPSMLSFLNLSLKDSLIKIGTNYVRGYTTIYGVPFQTKLLVYDEDTGDLIGGATSSHSNGFYYTEVPFVENCFIIGIGNDSYNHFILDKVTLQAL